MINRIYFFLLPLIIICFFKQNSLIAQSCPGSLLFDNNNPAVDLPATNQYYSGTNGGYTWECWFKLTQPFNSDPRSLISAVDGILFEDMWLGFGWQGGFFNSPVTTLVFKVDGPNSAVPSGPNCSYEPPGGFIIGNWYHVAGVMNYTTQSATLYLNGILVDSKPVTTPPITRLIGTELSFNVTNVPYPLYGNMDEVRMWDRPLSTMEVATNYNKCLSGNESNLLLYYRCNQPGGSSVADATGNNNTGTFSTNQGWSTQQAPVTGTACAVPVTTLTVAAVSNTLICAGQTATLTATGASSYIWSTGAVTAVTYVTPTITTSYTVTGTQVTCSGSNTGTAVVTVSVSPAANISATANPSLTCSGQTATLTAFGATSYTWNGTGIPANTSGSIVIVSPLATTVYSLTGEIGFCKSLTTFTLNVITNTVIIQNSSVCPGQSATLTSIGADNYSWNSSLSLSATTGSIVVASPSVTETYTITGTTGACTNSTTVTVSVVSNPTISINSNISLICPGKSAILTASGAQSYSWSPAVNLVSTDGSTVTANPIINTTYTVIGGVGTCTNTAFITINLLAQPIISASGYTTCAGSTATLIASGASTYTWLPGSVNNTSLNIINPLTTQIYTVSGSSPQGCVASLPVKLEVISVPLISIVSSPSLICIGSTATLSATGAMSYTWSTSDISPYTTIIPTAATVYTVSGSNSTGNTVCVSMSTIAVNVLSVITPTISPKDEICIGNSTKVYALGGNTWLWSPASGLSSVTNSIVSAKPLVTTVYTVTVSNNNLCPVSATVQIEVLPLPTIYAGRDTIINIGDSVKLAGTGNVYAGFISSSQGATLNCTFCSSLVVSPQETTCYTLMGENEFHCIAFDEVCVNVIKDWNIYIPNTFTPNEDAYNDRFMAYGYGISQIDMLIFDRWGHVLFKEKDTQLGWDGIKNGKVCEQGVYVYKLIILTINGTTIERVGHINLLPGK